jgi:hypothetical protein
LSRDRLLVGSSLRKYALQSSSVKMRIVWTLAAVLVPGYLVASKAQTMSD